MKLTYLIVFFFVFFTNTAHACTTFLLHKNNELVFGRNYDWITGNGMICSNQKNLEKQSYTYAGDKPMRWTSLYGSLTFNQYGKEFPTGGMNEKGLVVELMWLNDTKYPKEDKRSALGVLQWIQYQLDCCSTIEEVIATDRKIRISQKAGSLLHYLVADAGGHAATIEFLDGKMVIHKGNDLPQPVLTNTRYDDAVQSITKKYYDTQSGLGFTDNSVERFKKACNMITDYQAGSTQTAITEYAFSILDAVKQPSNTQWSIVYDISKKQIHFKSRNYPLVKTVSFNAFDFLCTASPKTFDINQAASGDVTGAFLPFAAAENKRIFEISSAESLSRFQYSDSSKNAVLTYGSAGKCIN